ncbi:uncharacterized protein F4822DRAFT_392239 [Hypoxylon trugodes]|uniref:uncharacterized protein n=1 Tax=Hypoxylon trugodes TaxID=326681 RepID=UPI002190C65E|nr:uncharacterized protein F4822DRAFT_392239 [Hypoxylon trugodes]KAI1392794.1 hypothetical protein F4822DRAFT_392239 [Hypoxylon trugodes]
MSVSSITTQIPTSPIEKWCVAEPIQLDGEPYQCANETLGLKESDFQTFCCDGEIINTVHDIWKPSFWKGTNHSVNLSDMVCCGRNGPQTGGIQPLPTAYTECSEGKPTPLADLAATNTKNAVPFLVTYTSASFGDNTVGDYIPTETPYCFWAYKSGAAMEEVTVVAAQITTLPPATTDEFGWPITTASETRPTSSGSGSGSDAAAKTTILSGTASSTSPEATTTPSGAGSIYSGVRKGYLCLGLGLVTMSLLWS